MSDKAVAVQNTDLTKEDHERIANFLEVGAPGFNLADGPRIARMMDLYLSGKTYSQIARIQSLPKDLVMCYSLKLNWYPLKMDYLQELELHLKGRVTNAKVASQDFLLQLTNMYQRKIGKKMDRYLKTDDEVEADKINLKEIDKYLKLVEALHKLSSEGTPAKGGQSAVGLNVGDGVTITKTGENSVEITPKSKAVGSMLEQLANQRRESELARNKTSDINEVTATKVEGEKENEEK